MTNWSPYQEAIFKEIEETDRNITIQAVAGSGKTTTLVEAVKRAKGKSVFLAFNKAIATELCSRGVNAKTFHGICYSQVMKHVGARNVEQNKLRRLMDVNFSYEKCRKFSQFSCKLTSLAKQSGIGCLISDKIGNYLDIVEHHDLESDTDFESETELEEGVDISMRLLSLNNQSQMIDFDDMLYFPILHDIVLPNFTNVFVDEAQDTNAIQRALLKKIKNSFNGRLIAVGDRNQAIYGFRGADSNSMDLITEEFNCVELPLSVNYRCGTSIIEKAQEYVDTIKAHSEAGSGVVERPKTWTAADLEPRSLTVCRTTRPLLELAYARLKGQLPVQILGREIGQGLIALIKKMKASDLSELHTKLANYRERETAKAMAKDNEKKADAINDKVDCIMFLIDSLDESENDSIEELMSVINRLFEQSDNAAILCTIHKSKGLEADTVYWLNSSQCPSKWAKKKWQRQQELNLCYVAITRAKNKLVYIEEENRV